MEEEYKNIDSVYLLKYLKKELSQEDISKVEQWIQASEDNRKTLFDLERIWLRLDSINDFEQINTDQDWLKVKDRIQFQDSKVKSLDSSKQFSISGFMKIAASLVFVTSLGLWVYQYLKNSTVEVITGNMENKAVTLPDGSKVILNSRSRIAYSKNFAENRALELEGEAYFEVVKNREYPFKVKSNNTITEVLGTVFNVNQVGKNTITTLISGKVAFYESGKQKNGILLNGGEQGVFAAGKIVKQKSKNSNDISWKTKELIFEDSKLKDVLSDLENYFKTSINVEDKSLLNCNYTGTFHEPNLDIVLKIIQETLEVTVTKKNDTYILSGKGCE